MGKCVKNSFQTTAYLRLGKIKSTSVTQTVTQSVIHVTEKTKKY